MVNMSACLHASDGVFCSRRKAGCDCACTVSEGEEYRLAERAALWSRWVSTSHCGLISSLSESFTNVFASTSYTTSAQARAIVRRSRCKWGMEHAPVLTQLHPRRFRRRKEQPRRNLHTSSGYTQKGVACIRPDKYSTLAH